MEFQVRLEPATQDPRAGFFSREGYELSKTGLECQCSCHSILKKAKTTQRLFISTTSHDIGQE